MKITWKSFCEWLANNIFSIFQILAPVVALIYRQLFTNNAPLTKLERFLIGIVVIGLIITIAKALWNVFSYRAYSYPRSKIATNYIIESKTIKYTMDKDQRLLYSRTVAIKSMISSLDSICDRYIWTGKSEIQLPIRSKGIQAINEEKLLGIWKYFRIILDEHIQKGDSRTIEYVWKPIENCTSSSPFFSASTEVPTKKLDLQIDLGDKFKGNEIILEELRAIDSDSAISTQQVKLDEHGAYKWTIKRVKRFRYYRIRWSWENSSVPRIPAD